jgi:hypothetical protein
MLMKGLVNSQTCLIATISRTIMFCWSTVRLSTTVNLSWPIKYGSVPLYSQSLLFRRRG